VNGQYSCVCPAAQEKKRSQHGLLLLLMLVLVAPEKPVSSSANHTIEVKKRAEKPNASWVLKFLAECDMRVDRFHLDNHCEKCKREYTVDGVQAWDDVNMSACEQFFGWLYELKSSFRSMFRIFLPPCINTVLI
jgi:hypothetical protein